MIPITVMLSRVADHLYWMSRYMERAESIARFVEVNQQLMWDVSVADKEKLQRDWRPVVSCLGLVSSFSSAGCGTDFEAVTDFLVFDEKNPSSVTASIRFSRENARAVRQEISTEMWEHINRSYHWITARAARQLYQRNAYEFFQRVAEISQTFQGVTSTTLDHSEAWDFIELGKHIERGEKTSRFLDDKFHLLTHRRFEVLQWSAVLRMCSARQAFQRIYTADVVPIRVAELLLVDETFPRSVAFCVASIDRALRRISGVDPSKFTNEAERLSGRLLAELRFTPIEEFAAAGFHDTMDRIQIELNRLGEAIYKQYIRYDIDERGLP